MQNKTNCRFFSRVSRGEARSTEQRERTPSSSQQRRANMADDEPKQRQNEEGVFWTKAQFKDKYGEDYKAKWKAAGKRSAEEAATDGIRTPSGKKAKPTPTQTETPGQTTEQAEGGNNAAPPSQEGDIKIIVDGKDTFKCSTCYGRKWTRTGKCSKPCTEVPGYLGTFDAAAQKRVENKMARKLDKKDATKPQTRQDTGAASSSSQAVQQQIAVVDVVQTRKTIDDIIRLLMKLKGHLVEFNLGVPVEETD
jgi:hypothetical protein